MPSRVEALRSNTLDNNLVWLESFGCTVRRGDGLIYVDHANLPEYRAYMIFGSPEQTPSKLETLLAELTRLPSPPTVYIDEESGGAHARRQLASGGFKPVSVNFVTAAALRPTQRLTNVSIKPAAASDSARWSRIYSTGFGRGAREAEFDLSRWQLAFESSAVRHWFFIKGDREVGVCQTCDSSGVTGVYSFTLLPPARGVHNIRGALLALRARLTESGKVVDVYFERVKAGLTQNLTPSGSRKNLIVIRKMIGFGRISTKS